MKKFFLTFFIALIIFSAVAFGFVLNDSGNTNLDKGAVDIDDEIMFLVVGIDTFDLQDAKGERTDTMILANVNFKTGNIDLVSIPRDTRVSVNGEMDKINHAHAKGGMELTMETVSNFLDVNLDYYVRMDYRAVEEVVEAIGGVDIYVPQDMKYDDPTPKQRVPR